MQRTMPKVSKNTLQGAQNPIKQSNFELKFGGHHSSTLKSTSTKTRIQGLCFRGLEGFIG
jgi:hypothetical protein